MGDSAGKGGQGIEGLEYIFSHEKSDERFVNDEICGIRATTADGGCSHTAAITVYLQNGHQVTEFWEGDMEVSWLVWVEEM